MDRLYYGWIIVVVALVCIGTFSGMRYSFGIFFKSLESEFELTRVATSSIYSVYTICTAIFVFMGGWALDKFGPRLVVSAMGLFTGLSLLTTSYITSFWQIFITYSVLLALGTSGAMVVLMSVVSRWFSTKRGFALGIAMSGTGFGNLLMAPFAAFLISSFGWRGAYMSLAFVAWIIIVSLAMLLRRNPSQMGLLPDGVKHASVDTQSIHNKQTPQMMGLSLKDAFKTRSFWLMLANWFLYATCMSFVLTHIVPHSTDTGISNIMASTIVSTMAGFQIIFRLLAGRLSDITGRKSPAIMSCVVGIVAMVWAIWVKDLWMFYLFALFWGLAWGGIGVTTMSMVSDVFGERNLGTIMGAIDTGYALGSAAGAALGGIVYDITNSYTLAFVISAVALLVMVILINYIRREVTR